MTPIRTVLLAAFVVAAAGCSTLESDYRRVGTQPLRNAHGHVIGHKEMLRNNGERITRIALYVPLVDGGKVIGYEEKIRGGTVLRGLDGRKKGGRFVDLRSQGTNPGNKGLMIIVHGTPAERVAAPDIEQLKVLAQLN